MNSSTHCVLFSNSAALLSEDQQFAASGCSESSFSALEWASGRKMNEYLKTQINEYTEAH